MKRFHVPRFIMFPLIALIAPMSCNPSEEVDEQALQDVTPQEVIVTDFSTLVGSEWRLVDFCGDAIPDDAGVTLAFLDGGRVAGSASVNRYNGAFATGEDGLDVGPFATTRMAGPPEAMERERDYLAALTSAKSVSTISGGQLVIAVDGRDLPLRYEVVQSP